MKDQTTRISINLSKVQLVLICAILPFCSIAQSFRLAGTIRGEQNEKLQAAQITIFPDSVHTISDKSGHFAIVVTGGEKIILITHLGYTPRDQKITLRKDTELTFQLENKVNQLQEIVIEGQRSGTEDLFESNQTSSHVLTENDVKGIPVLGGEADIIKTLQLLPGTIRGVEGSSDLFVRGGAADQNLVLLDDIPIYNTSHLFGFLSVFNPDVLDRVEAINGGFPASYGGRLSSVLDVRTKSKIPNKTHLSGDIGLIASRLFLEQPLVKDKASIWIAGRRTYIDQVIRLTGEKLPYFFYDLNGKIILKPTRRDIIEITHYSGDDKLDLFRDRNNDGDGFLTAYESGNSSQSIRWNRMLPSNWSGNLSVIRTNYHYNIRNAFDENELVARSNIEDYGARFSIQNDSIFHKGAFKSGVEWIQHRVSPSVINSSGSITAIIESSFASGRTANELGVFGQYEWSPLSRWRINVGIRGSMALIGNKHYAFPEPRLSARFSIDDNQAIKVSYSRMVQYMHRISNSAVSTPTDIWYPVTDSIRPQSAHQIALAWQNRFPDHNLYLNVEGYYKSMNDLIGYEEGTNLFLNTDFESKLIQGRGRAYGLEVLLRKDAGKLTGWLSYTLSWSWRQFDAINSGQWFPSRYDRRHNAALVMQYAFHKRWAVSVVWEFISGARFTPVIGQYIMLAPTLTGVDMLPVYADINSVKLANSHRLDIGIKFKSKVQSRIQWQWFVGAYNVYNRANPVGISIEQDEVDGSLRYLQPGLFGFLPFISYGFRF